VNSSCCPGRSGVYRPAQHHGSRGRATRVRVEVREAHAILRQRVEVRRLDLTAERAHVGEPQVIAKDETMFGRRGASAAEAMASAATPRSCHNASLLLPSRNFTPVSPLRLRTSTFFNRIRVQYCRSRLKQGSRAATVRERSVQLRNGGAIAARFRRGSLPGRACQSAAWECQSSAVPAPCRRRFCCGAACAVWTGSGSAITIGASIVDGISAITGLGGGGGAPLPVTEVCLVTTVSGAR